MPTIPLPSGTVDDADGAGILVDGAIRDGAADASGTSDARTDDATVGLVDGVAPVDARTSDSRDATSIDAQTDAPETSAGDASPLDGGADGADASTADASLDASPADAGWADVPSLDAQQGPAPGWAPVPRQAGAMVTTAYVFGIRVPPPVVVGFSDGEIYQAPDATAAQPSWTLVSTDVDGGYAGLPGLAVNALLIDTNGGIYAGFAGDLQGIHFFRRDATTFAWTRLTNAPFDEVWSLSLGFDAQTVYGVGNYGTVATSTDQGATWTSTPPPGDSTALPLDAGARVTAVDRIGTNFASAIVGTSDGHVYVNANASDPTKWQDITDPLMPPRLITRITTTLDSPPSFYVTYEYQAYDSVWGCVGGVWTNLTHDPLPHQTANSVYGFYGISVLPLPSGKVLTIDGTGGYAWSNDLGTTWTWIGG